MTRDYRHELQVLLRKLFQFDSADLDFGIYRIMNYKRDEIEKFIEEDLIKAVDLEFKKYSAKSKAEIENELEELKKRIASTLGEDALLPSGDLKELYRSSPISKELCKKKEDLRNYEMANEYKAEIISHIYQFFSRYYDEGDFISLRRYSRQNKYAFPYNGEEILLHWANKDQYYIKTGEYFKNYSFRIGDYKVNFRLSDAEADQNNNRSGIRFFLLKSFPDILTYDDNAKELNIFFEYRTLKTDEAAKYGTREVQKKILDEIHESLITELSNNAIKGALQKQEGEQTILKKNLLRYAKRNTTDYFIHKDLKSFLSGELDFYIKNEILILDDLGSDKERDVERYISRIRVVKSISLKIIDLLAQIEDFQKKLYLKKKFIIKSDYCMTLDKVPEALYTEIAQNADQIRAWKKILKLDEIGQNNLSRFELKSVDINYIKSHPHLVLDTKFFSEDFKDRLIASFSDLDSEINGLMIKSENFQALNLLKEKYFGKVMLIYIDPPFNTGNDGFIYKDNFQHSSWLSMMGERLLISRSLLSPKGLLFVSHDDIEHAHLRLLMDNILGVENHVGQIIWKARRSEDSRALTGLSSDHEYISCFQASEEARLRGDPKDLNKFSNPDGDIRGDWRSADLTGLATRDQRPNLHYDLIDPSTGRVYSCPPKGWRYDPKTMGKKIAEGKILFPDNAEGRPRHKLFLKEMKSIYKNLSSVLLNPTTGDGTRELVNIMGTATLSFPKPSLLIRKVIEQAPLNAVILDFFAGSGSTAHATISLNNEDAGSRKYILVEMADYFDTVMMPRIQKVIYSLRWEDGKPISNEGNSHIFKYLFLEQYEDTLNNIEFSEKNGVVQRTLQDLDGYFLRYMLDFETRDSPCRINVEELKNPFNYKLKITSNYEILDQKVDLIETFNFLLGIHVKRINAFIDNDFYYKAVLGIRGQETIAVIWRSTDGLDLEADKKFIDDYILKEFKADKVYVNSDCFVEGIIPIEPEFKRLMGA